MGVPGAGCDGYVEGGPTPLTPAPPAPSDSPRPRSPWTPAARLRSRAATAGLEAGPRMLFVAVGQASRTTVSCDNGRNWTAGRSDMPELRCSAPVPDGGSTDCDHDPEAGRGIAPGDGWFVANGSVSSQLLWTGTEFMAWGTDDTQSRRLQNGGRGLLERHARSAAHRASGWWRLLHGLRGALILIARRTSARCGASVRFMAVSYPSGPRAPGRAGPGCASRTPPSSGLPGASCAGRPATCRWPPRCRCRWEALALVPRRRASARHGSPGNGVDALGQA